MDKKFFNPNFDKNLNIKKGFTLAEVLVSLVILGIVAAIVVPSTVRSSLEKRNKVRIRKALASYESLVEKATIEYELRSSAALNSWANNDDQCTNGKQQFKISEVDPDFPCIFKTTDGLWWNIKNLDKTIVAFEQNDVTLFNALSRFSGYKAFMFVTEYDSNGSVRVNDKGYAPKSTSAYYELSVNKVQDYLDGVKFDSKIGPDLLAKYPTPCQMEMIPWEGAPGVRSLEPTNVPCSKVSEDGNSVTIYVATNDNRVRSYTMVTLTDCSNGENCNGTRTVGENIDNKDGTYTQISSIVGGKRNYIRTWSFEKGQGWYVSKVQDCDSSFSTCSCKTYANYSESANYGMNEGGTACSTSEITFK